MHKVTHFRLFHDRLFMVQVVSVIVPQAARVSLDFYLFFILWVPQTAVESWYIREIAPMRSY